MKLRDVSCSCGWKFPGFHICVDLTQPCPAEFSTAPKKVKRKRNYFPTDLSDEQLEVLAQGRAVAAENQRERVEKQRAKNVDRDRLIVEAYNKVDTGMQGVSEMVGVSRQTVRTVLLRAAELGLTEIRKPGLTFRYEEKEAV